MRALHLDFETFSACDLKSAGLDNYSKHPTTGFHCLAYAFDDEPVELFIPFDPKHERVLDHVEAGGIVYAHNAAFELAIWNNVCVPKFKWPRLKPEQVRCTMAMAYAMGLPGKLEHAAPALGILQRKDLAGSRIMLQLSQPKRDGTLWKPADDPEKFQRLFDYCMQDVRVERELHSRMLELSITERRLWILDYKINQHGVRVDLPAIEKALALVDREKERLSIRMLRATGSVVGSPTEVQTLVKWIRNQGVPMEGLAKADVLDALETDGLPAPVREALEIRKEAAKSSTAKLRSMVERSDALGIIRNAFQYHGAATGRWAARGLQLHNMPRPRPTIGPEEAADIVAHFGDPAYLDMMYGPVMDAIADSLRALVVPRPGHDLVACDFSAIEARVIAWLAGEESVLDVFRGHGKIYEHAASGIYRKPMAEVTKDERQIGKVAVLALGYQGGVGAFQQMARGYNVKVPDSQAEEIKTNWRAAHPHIVRYWYDVEGAALDAMTSGGTCKAGKGNRAVAFKKSGSFLWCRLPSGRVLCYPYPEIREIDTPWGEKKDALTYMASVADSKGKVLPDPAAEGKWQRVSTYGGSLVENITQAVARDLLAEAMLRLDDYGYQIVMHVHDEIVVEIPEAAPVGSLKLIESLMARVPTWAEGLPVAAEGWRAKRYRK